MKKTIWFLCVVVGVFCRVQAQNLKVTSPNGGELLLLEEPWSIAWSASGISSNVRIQLIKPGGGLVGLITTNRAPGASPYTWLVGPTASGPFPPGSYKVRVTALDGSAQDESDAPFTIAGATPPPDNPGPTKVAAPRFGDLPSVLLKFPRLEVSDIDLAPNAEGFGIVFNYKNVGSGALPKAAEVKEKPSYRVLIDGKETASGALFIPAFAAQPGWEQKGYFGGWIVQPTGVNDYSWHIGNTITVHINENKVMGMESHTLSLDLKAIALKYAYDLICNSVVYDWDTNKLAMSVRIDGDFSPNKKLEFFCSGEFHVQVDLNPGQRLYSLSPTLYSDTPKDRNWIVLRAGALLDPVPYGSSRKIMDIDLRNNFGEYRFTRPPK